MKYHVWVCLEMEDEVEASSPEEAFLILSEDAMSGGSWAFNVEEIKDDEEEID